MNIAIVGAGFTGLSAGYVFSKEKNRVTIFEANSEGGGLAVGYKKPHWDYSLETHYHHWFANDNDALSICKELDVSYEITRPKTSVLVDKHIYQLDSIAHVLSFPKLSILSKIRMLGTLGTMRINPFWQPLEYMTAHNYLRFIMGKKSYEMLWEPQLSNKFASYYKDISLAWFWARIRKRTAELAYPTRGFSTLASAFVRAIEANGGSVRFNTRVDTITSREWPVITFSGAGHISGKEQFDIVIWTAPLSIFLAKAQNLPKEYIRKNLKLKSLGAINIIFRMNKQFLQDGTYWLSICQKNSPVMAIVEHTNFIEKKHYGNEHLVYVGNYMETTNERYLCSNTDYLRSVDSVLSSINQSYKNYIIGYDIFRTPFAQPIVPIKYSLMKPDFFTPLPNVFTATMQHIYPWDRGTNYAIELGKKVAHGIINASL